MEIMHTPHCWHASAATGQHRPSRPSSTVPSLRHHCRRHHIAWRCPAASDKDAEFDIDYFDTADEAIEAGRQLCASQKYETAVECFEKVPLATTHASGSLVTVASCDVLGASTGPQLDRSRDKALQVRMLGVCGVCSGT